MTIKPIINEKKVFLRNIGKDEKWLQSELDKNPSLLPFDNLISIQRERRQSSGGKLDLLYADDDNSMYEVEVMLGETDPSHIIRCIEYWEIERRRFPHRQHYAVLVAESFNRRYFNVVQLLSLNIPMIAVQMDVIETDNQYVLNFTKIMDIYEEPEIESDSQSISEDTWIKDASWVNNFAKKLLVKLHEIDSNLYIKYNQNHMSISAIGGNNQFDFNKRTNPNIRISFKVSNPELKQEIEDLLIKEQVDTDYSKHKCFTFTSETNSDKLINLLTAIYKIKYYFFKKDILSDVESDRI